MKEQALNKLLGVREHRVDAARAAFEAAQRALQTRENEAAHLQTSLERTLITRMGQQRAFGDKATTKSVAMIAMDAQHSERYVGRLTAEATRIGEKIAKARKAVAKAKEDVVTARRALRHALAKRDALVKLLREQRQETARRVARMEDEESEEIAARRVPVL